MEESKKTKDLEIDETQLSPEDKKEMGTYIAKGPLIIIGILVILIVICVIVIYALGGPTSEASVL